MEGGFIEFLCEVFVMCILVFFYKVGNLFEEFFWEIRECVRSKRGREFEIYRELSVKNEKWRRVK